MGYNWKVSKIFTKMNREMNRSSEKLCSAEEEEKASIFFSYSQFTNTIIFFLYQLWLEACLRNLTNSTV